MTDQIDKDDLRDVRDTILKEMRAGFLGVHARQDKTNGRVTAQEIQTAKQGTRLRALEARIFGRRDSDRPPKADGDTSGITQRDVRMFVAGGGALTAAVLFLWKVVPFLVQAVKAP